MRISAEVTAATPKMTGHSVNETGAIPKRVLISFCHPTCRHAEKAAAQPISTTSTPTTIVRVRPFGFGTSRNSHSHWPPAPSP